MKQNKLKKFITNNYRFNKDHSDYSRVFLLNTLLLTFFILTAVYTVLNIIFPCDSRVIYIDAFSCISSVIILVYLHKTDNINIVTFLFTALLLTTFVLYIGICQNSHYALFWICALPPVMYSILGKKKASIVLILFYGYMLFFILSNKSGWRAGELDAESLINISGSIVALILMINYYEMSRKEATDALIVANGVLEDSKNELRLILDSAAEGIYGIDSNGLCTFCNTRALELLGFENEQSIIGKDTHLLIHHSRQDGSALSKSECNVQRALTSGEKVHSEDEVFFKADGTFFNVEYYSYPKYRNGVITGAVITFTDITKRKKNEERIQYLSCHDALTGLINRQHFEENIKKYDKEIYYPISIIYADINGLKLTNDIFGHEAGDSLIKSAADKMIEACRGNDIIARTGGDEFIWLLPGTGKDEAKEIIKKVKEDLRRAGDPGLSFGLSMGCDTKCSKEQDISHIMKNAENEMYLEKVMHRKNDEAEILHNMISSLHERSPREKIHSENTSMLCKKVGQALGWSAAEIKKIKDAGYFHDVGKIVLRDELLFPDRELTPEENFEKKQHAVVGYRILNIFNNMLDLAESVYYHHERWDGSGYPKGLRGKEIPVIARIIAVVEGYDAMTNIFTDEIIKSETALELIKEQSGIRYDPEIADVFIKMMTEEHVSK